MTNFNGSDHPRVSDGTFTEKTQSTPEVAVTGPAPTLGSFPVARVGLPNVAVYRWSASALVAKPDGTVVPYFSGAELARAAFTVNSIEAESGDEGVTLGEHDGAPCYIYPSGALQLLPSIDAPGGTLYGIDNVDHEFEIAEGEWFDTTPPAGAAVEGITRSWTVRRDDGQYITRTVEWTPGEYTDPDSGRLDGFSVWKRVEDTVADSFGQDAIQEPVDQYTEDTLATDRVFETLAEAENWARIEARHEQSSQHVDGWDGYEE